jgi:hypothetical protein
MATVTQPTTTRGERLRQELITLAFITRGGNWLFLFMSRLAEPLMFFATLYVIAETVLPQLFKAATFAGVSNVAIIVLNIAPELILPGCFLQAGMAAESQRWMYKSMGVVFMLLTFATLASFIWTAPAGVVSVILFFRCSAGVLYSLLVRMTPQQHQDGPNNQQHQAELDELTNTFNQQVQRLTAELSRIETNLQNRLTESSTGLANSLQQQLANELAPLQENLQKHQEELALVPNLQAQLQQIESSTIEEVRRVKATIEKQAQTPAGAQEKRNERPTLLALPSREKGKFDARAFVFGCLQKDAECKLADMAKLAALQGQELSQSSISRYRSQFFASSESSTVDENGSSAMQVASEESA